MSRDKCTVPAKKNDVMQVKYIIYQVYMIGPLQQREWVMVLHCFVILPVVAACTIDVCTLCFGSRKWKTTLMAFPVFGSMPYRGGVTRGVSCGFSSGIWSVWHSTVHVDVGNPAWSCLVGKGSEALGGESPGMFSVWVDALQVSFQSFNNKLDANCKTTTK